MGETQHNLWPPYAFAQTWMQTCLHMSCKICKRERKEGRKEFKGRVEIKKERKLKLKSTMKQGCTLVQEFLSLICVWILSQGNQAANGEALSR